MERPREGAAALLDRGGWSRVVLQSPYREDATAVLAARLPGSVAAALAAMDPALRARCEAVWASSSPILLPALAATRL